MNLETQILIIGAGPGGVACALQLAQKGIACTIVDKSSFPRDKICGDALSGKVVEVLKKINPTILNQLQLQPTQIGSWGVSFVAPNEKVLRIPFKQHFDKNTQQAPGYIAKRIDFDDFLVKQLQPYSTLVKFLPNIALQHFEKTPKGYLCSNKEKTIYIHAELVIAADGAQSAFAKTIAGIKMENQHYSAGIRAYYKNVAAMDTDNFIELHFIKDLLPGYFWIFPLPNGEANVGLGIRSDYISKHKLNLKKILEEIVATHPAIKNRFQAATLIVEVKGFGLPLGSKKRNISGDNFLLIGDAASLIDPFTGEGIGNAMMSGMLAAHQAQQCLQENRFDATFNKSYDQAVYQRLWNELKLSRTMQQLVAYPWLFNFIVNKAQTNTTLKETISAMFEDLDLRSRLKQPSFYFKLLLD